LSKKRAVTNKICETLRVQLEAFANFVLLNAKKMQHAQPLSLFTKRDKSVLERTLSLSLLKAIVADMNVIVRLNKG